MPPCVAVTDGLLNASLVKLSAGHNHPRGTMRILGLMSQSHDSGVALVEDGAIIAVLEEERHNREKHTLDFPRQSLTALFGPGSGRSLDDIDVITTPWDPKRLRRSFGWALLRRFPLSLALIHDNANPAQDGGVIAMNPWIRFDLARVLRGQRRPPIVNVGHHESHAAMFFVSPFEDATVVVLDALGDDAASSVFTGAGNRLERQWRGKYFDSIGMVYTLVTRHLGYEVFEEGTVMALAALGRDRAGQNPLIDKVRDLVRPTPDGRFAVNMDYFSFDTFGLLRPLKRKFYDTFGQPRSRNDPITAYHEDLAYAVQTVTEEIVLHVVRSARQRFPSRNLVLVGGVALNCVANARLLEQAGFDRIWVPPCASDTGAPLGSALYHYHQTLGHKRSTTLDHAYYGLAYDQAEIASALTTFGMTYRTLDDAALIEQVAQDLAQGRIVGWFQGRYEIGPRALGNRSILASPTFPGVRDLINQRVKFREPFRPFAPAVLAERASEFFEIDQPDPFMTMAPRVRPGVADKIPAAVHVDGTARLQTVDRATNPRYHALISRVGELTGVPVIINTSFNKQEPVVARPEEAISCFLRTDMHALAMGNTYTTDRPEAAMIDARMAFDVLEVNTRSGE